MRPKFFFLLACTVLLALESCSGGAKYNASPEINVTENLLPYYQEAVPGAIVFTGVSAKLSSRDESVRLAVEDAARRLSFFHSVSGNSVKSERIGTEVMDIRIESEYHLGYDKNLEKYITELKFDPVTDIFENNNAVFVIARVISDTVMPEAAGHSFGNKRPHWIDSPPAEIGGFSAGVGFSGRLSSHCETVVRSYEKSVIAIIENIESRVADEKQIIQNTYSAFDFSLVSSGETRLSGSLEKFYVIESWTDLSNLSVWTLAVAGGSGS